MTEFFCAGHALIRDPDGALLILKRSRENDYRSGYWDFPGGTVEPGETVEEAVIREVWEETGLQVEVVRPVFVYSNKLELPARQTIQIVFECRLINLSRVRLNSDEHSEAQWVSEDELHNFKLIEFVKEMLNEPDLFGRSGAIFHDTPSLPRFA